MPKSKTFTQGRTPPSFSGGRGYDGGKPCPTCYAPMSLTGKTWACTKHGQPSKP